MKNDVINGAAQIYYDKNVVGEPLDQDTPFECFMAGAQFVINARKKRNNCNLPENNSYNAKKKRHMDMMKTVLKNVEKIIKVSGFHITAPGDPSVGILPASWEMKNDFYFDTPEELEEFRKEIKLLYEFHCGEVTSVVTFEEYQAELEAELVEEYKQFPVRYLIRDDEGGDMFMKPNPFTGMYSSDVGECIHYELEDWIKNSHRKKHIIPSTSEEYWDILREGLAREQQSANVNGQHYHSAKKSIRNILQELEYGK